MFPVVVFHGANRITYTFILSFFKVHLLVFDPHGNAEHMLSFICVYNSKWWVASCQTQIFSGVALFFLTYIDVLFPCWQNIYVIYSYEQGVWYYFSHGHSVSSPARAQSSFPLHGAEAGKTELVRENIQHITLIHDLIMYIVYWIIFPIWGWWWCNVQVFSQSSKDKCVNR